MAIHTDPEETTETAHDRDHQDGIGIGTTEIAGKEVLQGIRIVLKATSAEE